MPKYFCITRPNDYTDIFPHSNCSVGARDARAAELLNGADIRLRCRSAGLRFASPHCGASAPSAHPHLGGAAHLAPIGQPILVQKTKSVGECYG
jgi:hypothetical protein